MLPIRYYENKQELSPFETEDDAVQFLKDWKCNPHRDTGSDDSRGDTMLHICLKRNQKKVVQYLLENKANVNISNHNGYTPLHVAAIYCPEAICPLLLYEADPTAIGADGVSVMMLAAHFCPLKALKALLSKCKDTKKELNAIDRLGNGLMLYAAQGQNFEVLEFLLTLRKYTKETFFESIKSDPELALKILDKNPEFAFERLNEYTSMAFALIHDREKILKKIIEIQKKTLKPTDDVPQ